MVSELLHNEHSNPAYWALWQISLGSMACMCCVVFMGLKLKWFRAQLRLGDSPSSRVASVPVQGVGFKLKTNPDDFQLYKVTSEFAPVTNKNQQKPIQQQNGSQNKNPYSTSMTPVTSKPVSQTTNKSTTITQVSSKLIPQSTTSNVNKPTSMTQVQSKPVSQSTNSNKSSNATNNKTTNSSVTDSKINIPKVQPSIKENSQTNKPEIKPQSILKKQDSAEKLLTDIQTKTSTVNFEENQTEISNPSPQKYSDLINKPLKQNTLTKTNDDDEYEQQITKEPYKKPGRNKQEQAMKKQQKTNINNVAKQPMFQIRNPLASHNIVMPMENEDDWKIQIVDEKTKVQPKQEKGEENINELYFRETNSGMYSSQAANIFFGGPAPVAQPRARKFVEMDEDNISRGSNTSA